MNFNCSEKDHFRFTANICILWFRLCNHMKHVKLLHPKIQNKKTVHFSTKKGPNLWFGQHNKRRKSEIYWFSVLQGTRCNKCWTYRCCLYGLGIGYSFCLWSLMQWICVGIRKNITFVSFTDSQLYGVHTKIVKMMWHVKTCL